MPLGHKTFHGSNSMRNWRKRFGVLIWTNDFQKMIWSFYDQIMIQSISIKRRGPFEFHETFSKIMYDYNFDRLALTLRNSIYQDFNWDQTTFNNNVNKKHFFQKIIWKLFTNIDSILFFIRIIHIDIFNGTSPKVYM